jgi:hypothetical protein
MMVGPSHASETQERNDKQIYSVEYFGPIHESRDIRTVTANFSHLLSRIERLNLSIHYGVTGTYATGSIGELEGSLSDGTLRQVRYDNTAFGLGPGLSGRLGLLDIGSLSACLSGSGNLLVYTSRFPAGGDYYNFMWRGCPLMEFRIGKSRSIGVSYQRAHISNGQGLRSRNPAYDARGIALMFNGFF